MIRNGTFNFCHAELAVPAKLRIGQNWLFQVILSHFSEKDWKSCKSGKNGHSEPLQWEKIGKVVNWVKLAVLSHSEPLWWKKIA